MSYYTEGVDEKKLSKSTVRLIVTTN